jgi:Tol biopolymer transport system component
MSRTAVLAAACLSALLLAAPSANAAFPGANGKIAFDTNRDGGDFEIYVMDASGANQTRLTNQAGQDSTPSWSPDGTKIVFVSARDGNFEIYSMNADGSSQTRLTTNGASDVTPMWSADGTKIAFATNRDGNFEVYTMNANGTSPTRLTNNSALDSDPAWSPNDDKIAFLTNRDGNQEIYTMNTDGTGQTNFSNDPSFNNAKPDWAPDGDFIAYEREFGPTDHDVLYRPFPSGTQAAIAGSTLDELLPGWAPDDSAVVFAHNSGGDFEICVRPQVQFGTAFCSPSLTTNTATDGAPDWQPAVRTPARPSSANKIYLTLVAAQKQCFTPNSNHRGTISSDACVPTVPGSDYLRMGSTAKGSVRIKAFCNGGAAGEVPPCSTTSGDQLDGKIDVSLDDVRCVGTSGGCSAALADYTNSLLFDARFRITDRNVAGGMTFGTMTEYDLRFNVPCSTTPSPTIGSTCSITTSIDAAIGGNTAITELKRAMWELTGNGGAVKLYDGGADGSAGTFLDNTLFANAGLFFE